MASHDKNRQRLHLSKPKQCLDGAGHLCTMLRPAPCSRFMSSSAFWCWKCLVPYHNEVHSALGSSPAAAWATGIACITQRVPPDTDALLLDFLPFEPRIVRRDGVRLFNITYQDGCLAHLVDNSPGKLRIKYDPRDLAAVFVELPTGAHVRVPYADIRRRSITLWEHREATRRLQAAGRRGVDEHAIFTAVEEQRRVLVEAQSQSKAARRAIARIGLTERATNLTSSAGQGAQDDEAKVPMPSDDETSGVEFW